MDVPLSWVWVWIATADVAEFNPFASNCALLSSSTPTSLALGPRTSGSGLLFNFDLEPFDPFDPVDVFEPADNGAGAGDGVGIGDCEL